MKSKKNAEKRSLQNRPRAEPSPREHSPYAKDKASPGTKPEERGDYWDWVKKLIGRGNASKGPYKEQNGEGYGRNYGAREDRAKPDDNPSE